MVRNVPLNWFPYIRSGFCVKSQSVVGLFGYVIWPVRNKVWKALPNGLGSVLGGLLYRLFCIALPSVHGHLASSFRLRVVRPASSRNSGAIKFICHFDGFVPKVQVRHEESYFVLWTPRRTVPSLLLDTFRCFWLALARIFRHLYIITAISAQKQTWIKSLTLPYTSGKTAES